MSDMHSSVDCSRQEYKKKESLGDFIRHIKKCCLVEYEGDEEKSMPLFQNEAQVEAHILSSLEDQLYEAESSSSELNEFFQSLIPNKEVFKANTIGKDNKLDDESRKAEHVFIKKMFTEELSKELTNLKCDKLAQQFAKHLYNKLDKNLEQLYEKENELIEIKNRIQEIPQRQATNAQKSTRDVFADNLRGKLNKDKKNLCQDVVIPEVEKTERLRAGEKPEKKPILAKEDPSNEISSNEKPVVKQDIIKQKHAVKSANKSSRIRRKKKTSFEAPRTYLPDECIFCEYYHVFGTVPVNMIKAYDLKIKEDAVRNMLENYRKNKDKKGKGRNQRQNQSS